MQCENIENIVYEKRKRNEAGSKESVMTHHRGKKKHLKYYEMLVMMTMK